MKNAKFKIIIIRTGYQHVGYFYCTENLNWAAPNLRLDRGLDIADLDLMFALRFVIIQTCIRGL